MMSFPLRRLPILAIREVIKSMNTKEILYLSGISKKSQNLVMLSIPKHSLSVEFTFRKYGLAFELMPNGFKKQEAHIIPLATYRAEEESAFTGFSPCGLYILCELTYNSEVEDSTRKFFNRFSKTFEKSKISLKFENGTREKFAMEIIKFAWDNNFSLEQIDFCLPNASPESIRELLNGCHNHCTSLDIRTKVPIGFKCAPPPGGCKIDVLAVNYAHWINLDVVLQCRRVVFRETLPDLTPEDLNGLLKKIVNLESRIESFIFKLKGIEPTDFSAIVDGLSDSEIKQDGTWRSLQIERKDGLKLLISHFDGYIYLESR